MSNIEERVQHNEDLIRGLSEQTSGNITIINSNCKMLANRLEAIEKKIQELETKTASDLSQSTVEESEERECLWVARDKRGGRLYVYEVEPIEQWCDTFDATDEDENCLKINPELFPQVTFENSPQKLVLESAISKNETVGDGYVPTIDDFFYNPEEENSEKPNNQEFDKERALELLQDIESSSTKNSNASTKAILLSCAELREMLGGE